MTKIERMYFDEQGRIVTRYAPGPGIRNDLYQITAYPSTPDGGKVTSGFRYDYRLVGFRDNWSDWSETFLTNKFPKWSLKTGDGEKPINARHRAKDNVNLESELSTNTGSRPASPKSDSGSA